MLRIWGLTVIFLSHTKCPKIFYLRPVPVASHFMAMSHCFGLAALRRPSVYAPTRAALSAGVEHVLLVSSMGTTQPDTFLDLLGEGHALFYKLNGWYIGGARFNIFLYATASSK
jgi:hypothetical protein